MPLKNTRKLWKLMFTEAWNNEDSIANIKQWLLDAESEFGCSLTHRECEMLEAQQKAEESRRVKEAHGSVATKEINEAAREARKEAQQAETVYKSTKRNLEKLCKLKTDFHNLHQRYWF
jgi:molecular chaperone DnaK (HSP70)